MCVFSPVSILTARPKSATWARCVTGLMESETSVITKYSQIDWDARDYGQQMSHTFAITPRPSLPLDLSITFLALTAIVEKYYQLHKIDPTQVSEEAGMKYCMKYTKCCTHDPRVRCRPGGGAALPLRCPCRCRALHNS